MRTARPMAAPWQGPALRLGLLLPAVWLGVLLLAHGCTAAAQAVVSLERILAGERLAQPVHLALVPDGSGDLMVVEQRGVVKRFAPGAATATVFLHIRDRVSSGGEEGLLSIAFHPRFADNRTFYVYFSAASPRRSVLARFLADGPGGAGNPASGSALLEVAQPYSNHNGGQIAFGPDGMLYVALGDGGSGGDPLGHGQNRATLLGSILRIDVDGSAPGLAYGIPADNPFVGAGDGSRAELWAYGLRNPWRFSFDRETGALYAGDVGQNAVEEVDRIVRGGNYGWNAMEGSRCYQPPQGCPRAGLELPIAEYTHGQGRSITGGFVYRGSALPTLRGRYLFADYVEGRIWSIPAQGAGPHPPQALLDTGANLSSFGEDGAGELYVLDHQNGRIYRLVPAR